MTAGAAGAGGSVVGGAAAVLMVAVALNGAPAWRTASVDPAQQRPLFLRPEVVRHARRHRAHEAPPPVAVTGPIVLARPARVVVARHGGSGARRHVPAHRHHAVHRRPVAAQPAPAAPPVAPAPTPVAMPAAPAPAPVVTTPAAPAVEERPVKQKVKEKVKDDKRVPTAQPLGDDAKVEPGPKPHEERAPEHHGPHPDEPAPPAPPALPAPAPPVHAPPPPKPGKAPDKHGGKQPHGKPGRGGLRSA